MITVVGAPLDRWDEFSVSGNLLLNDPAGIRRVLVFDRFGALRTQTDLECPVMAEIPVAIARSRLPLSVRGISCDGSPTELPLIWTTAATLGGPGVPLPGDALRCEDSAGCGAAEAAALRARNQIAVQCTEVEAAKSVRDAAAAVATVMYALAGVLFAAAGAVASIPGFGQALALALTIAGAVALVAALIASYIALDQQMRLDRAYTALRDERQRFTDAAAAVLTSCSRGCITVDLNQPAC